jgi:hypothetical protein
MNALAAMEAGGHHLGEGKLLQHLLQEAEEEGIDSGKWRGISLSLVVPAHKNSTFAEHERELSTEQQLQNMIENYQQHVLKQKHYPEAPAYVNGHANGGSIDGPAKSR